MKAASHVHVDRGVAFERFATTVLSGGPCHEGAYGLLPWWWMELPSLATLLFFFGNLGGVIRGGAATHARELMYYAGRKVI